MMQRVGTCSLCGGDVMGYRGIWMAVVPPPPDRCAGCGAVNRSDVIEMRRPGGVVQRQYTTSSETFTYLPKETPDAR